MNGFMEKSEFLLRRIHPSNSLPSAEGLFKPLVVWMFSASVGDKGVAGGNFTSSRLYGQILNSLRNIMSIWLLT